MPNPTKKNGSYRAAIIKLIGSILVALIGLSGVIYSHLVNLKTDDNQAASEKTIEALMDQLNKLVIPQIQKELEEIKYDLKTLVQDESAARERIARIEALLEAINFRRREHKREEHKGFWKGLEPGNILSRHEPAKKVKPTKIPMISRKDVIQQQAR